MQKKKSHSSDFNTLALYFFLIFMWDHQEQGYKYKFGVLEVNDMFKTHFWIIETETGETQ